MSLTMFILPADNENCFHKCIDSLMSIPAKAIPLTNRNLEEVEFDTDWYGYLYADEYLSDELIVAIPIFLESSFDVITLLRRHENNRYTQAPRLFRKGIRLKCRVPIEIPKERYTRALDGWIEGL